MRLFERSLFYTRVRNDQNQIVLWSNNGSESMYLYTIPVLPIDPQSSFGGAAYAQWHSSNGATDIKPTDPELLKGFELLRSAVSQPWGDAPPSSAAV
jgi:peptide/nickel transport system substrate-binding protein